MLGMGSSRGGAEGAEACRVHVNGGNLLGRNACANFHHGLPSENLALRPLRLCERFSCIGWGGSRGGAECAEACVTDGGNLLGKNACANFHHGLPFLCCCSANSMSAVALAKEDAPLREMLLPWKRLSRRRGERRGDGL